MKKQNLVDSIRVSSPCAEDWDEMTGNKKVRFCSHCDLNVNNLSEMTKRETMRLVERSGGKLCVRYIEHPETKAPVFADRLYQIGRRAGIAAGVLGATLAASTITYAQGATILGRENLNGKSKTASALNDKKVDLKKDKSAIIFGIVSDSEGAVIPNVEVTLINQESEQKIVVRSNDAGGYEFKNVSPAVYTIEFNAQYFEKHLMENIKIDSRSVGEFNASLKVAGETIQLMGVIAFTRTPFETAIVNGDVKLVQDFISKGVNVNKKDENGEDSTPLHLAMREGNLKIVQILLNSGANVNAEDYSKNMPLMEIDENTSPEIIRLLVRHGAKINERNDSGFTALMQAADVGNLNVVKVLLESGANVNLKDNDGETAWDLTDDEKIKNLLIGYGAIIGGN